MSLQSTCPQEQAKECLTEACATLTLSVFKSVAIGISSDHFTPFVFKMCCSINLHGDILLGIKPTITMSEWTIFLQNINELNFEAVNSPEHSSTNVCYNKRLQSEASKSSFVNKPTTFSEEKWDAALRLECSLGCFANLRNELSHHAISSSPDSGDFWGTLLKKPYFMQLSKFQHLIIIRHLAPGCLLPSVKQFISSEFGESYCSKPLINLKEIFESTDSCTPVMFILTPGNCRPLYS